MTKCNNLS